MLGAMVKHFEEIRSPELYESYHPHGVVGQPCGTDTSYADKLRNAWMVVLFLIVAFGIVTIIFLFIQYS